MSSRCWPSCETLQEEPEHLPAAHANPSLRTSLETLQSTYTSTPQFTSAPYLYTPQTYNFVVGSLKLLKVCGWLSKTVKVCGWLSKSVKFVVGTLKCKICGWLSKTVKFVCVYIATVCYRKNILHLKFAEWRYIYHPHFLQILTSVE